ncbi:MAG TPA: protein kinase [Nannocystaceae bacterium]|nr:protein kinase [Nannocystaceae bacterium]
MVAPESAAGSNPGASSAGDRLGRYELLRRLGSGGMADVHLARAAGLEGFQKLVVLKRILPHLSADPEFVRMFLAEARLAAILDHPNVVQVFDIGKENRDYFFTMEYVYGENLHTLLKVVRRRGDALPLEHALTVGIGAASGLHYAHERVGFDGMPLQIVHRDVSPTNVMITYDGCVKMADFGIAKVTSRTDVTRAGIRKGKVPYMSPEQCRAEPLDRRSDVFAIGIALYECTTMQRLFEGDNEFGVMNRIVNGDVPLPSTKREGYPKELERIVMKALARDRDKRYATGAELAADLERFARDRRIRIGQAALGEYMHAMFEPRPFPFGALLGSPSQAAAAALATGEGSGLRSSVPAMRVPNDITPASHPSMTAASRSRSQIGSVAVVQRGGGTLRGVAIGLGLVAAVALVAVGGGVAFMKMNEGNSTPAPASAPPTPAAAAVGGVAPTPAVQAPAPANAPSQPAVPTADAGDDVPAANVAETPSVAETPTDEAPLIVEEDGTRRPSQKKKSSSSAKKSDKSAGGGEAKKEPDLDSFLPH